MKERSDQESTLTEVETDFPCWKLHFTTSTRIKLYSIEQDNLEASVSAWQPPPPPLPPPAMTGAEPCKGFWLDKSWGNPDRNVVVQAVWCWWTRGKPFPDVFDVKARTITETCKGVFQGKSLFFWRETAKERERGGPEREREKEKERGMMSCLACVRLIWWLSWSETNETRKVNVGAVVALSFGCLTWRFWLASRRDFR